ncbi:MAG: AbrB/MazE/SpoVT family DNA-binding domain-containing protein [Phyllobacteriaceae bacterium]|nr:AbrB/MazE/SpoVT family DNA-binding domain-containing protein [Phyllobacteriaceae bacterium]
MNRTFQVEATSSVTSKGQTTIPKEMRDAMGIKDGTALRWRLENGVLTVRAKSKRLEDFAGALGVPPNGRSITIEEMNDDIGAAVAERFARSTQK